MAWRFTTNVLLPAPSDKLGMVMITLKNALVATGRWRVRASGDGTSQFQNQGQTAGIGGSFDVFTANPAWGVWGSGGANSISNMRSWYMLEEIASGRVWGVGRESNGNAYYLNWWTGMGAASSGATAVTPPATLGNQYWSGANQSIGTELNAVSMQEHWLQIVAEDAVRPGNVSPWFLAVWSRSNNIPVGGAFWAAMEDTDQSVVNNVIAAMGPWDSTFGTPGIANGGLSSTGKWRGGDSWLITTLATSMNAGVGASPPYYQPLNADGKMRTQRPWVLIPSAGSRHLGRLKDIYLNKLPCEYPTVHSTPDGPRLTLGHLLVPWTNVVPGSSP